MHTTPSNKVLKHRAREFGKAILLVLLLCPAIAYGITISVNPPDQTVPLGAPVSISVAVAGLGSGVAPSVGAFDFNLGFNPAVLAFNSITFGDPVLGDQLGPILGSIAGSSVDPVTGLVNQFEISLELPADLDALQSDAFVLTSLTFSSIGVGTSPLNISEVILGDANGDPLSAEIRNGTARVVDIGVPDSGSTALLLSASMFAFGAAWRKRL